MKESKILSFQEMKKINGGLYEPPDETSPTGAGEADSSQITQNWDPSWQNQCLVWDSDYYSGGQLYFEGLRPK